MGVKQIQNSTKLLPTKNPPLFAFNSEYVAPSYGFNETNNENFDKYIDKYYDLYSKGSFTFAQVHFFMIQFGSQRFQSLKLIIQMILKL